MTSVGLDVADLAAPEKWIPAGRRRHAAAALGRRESGHEDFGLLLAGRRRLSTLGPLSVVLRQEPDLRSALRPAERLRAQLQRGAATCGWRRAATWPPIRLWLEFAEPAPTRQSLELATAALLGIIRELLGAAVGAAVGVLLPPAPASLDAHHDVFGPRLQFDHPFTGLVFFADQLDAPNTMSDPAAPALRAAVPAGRCRSPRGATVSGPGPRARRRAAAARPLLDARRSPATWA